MNVVASLILAWVLAFWPLSGLTADSQAAAKIRNGQTANGGVPDPTINVLNLVDASIKRLDDLATLQAKRADDLRAADIKLRELADKRLDDLIAAEQRRVNEQATMRDIFYEKQRDSEALRINAIRAVDVGAVSTANDRATQTASTLAAQVTQTAENARSLVSSSATSIASAQAAFAAQINERITNLEKQQNLGQGQNAPAQVQANAQAIAALQKSQNEASGKGAGISDAWGYLLAGLGLLVTLFMLRGFLEKKPQRSPVEYDDRPPAEPIPVDVKNTKPVKVTETK